MSSGKFNLIALGSCRICVALNDYQNTYNTWGRVCNRDANPKCVIGRSWSINEQLDILKLIKGDKPFDEYIGREYPNIQRIQDNLYFLRQIYNQIDALIVEVSSLSYFQTKSGKLIHNMIHEYPLPKHIDRINMSVEKLRKASKDFIEYSQKPIFFVSHFSMDCKAYRRMIWDCLSKVSTDYENVSLIDMSKMTDIESNDGEHYTSHGNELAREYMSKIISNYLKD